MLNVALAWQQPISVTQPNTMFIQYMYMYMYMPACCALGAGDRCLHTQCGEFASWNGRYAYDIDGWVTLIGCCQASATFKITSWSRYGLWIYSVSLLVSFCRFFCQIFSWCCFKGSRWRCHTIKINSMCLECLSWFWKVEKKDESDHESGKNWSKLLVTPIISVLCRNPPVSDRREDGGLRLSQLQSIVTINSNFQRVLTRNNSLLIYLLAWVHVSTEVWSTGERICR